MIVYHELLQEWGLVSAALGQLSPYASMWGLFAVFVTLSAFIYRRSVDQARNARAAESREEETVRVPVAESEPEIPHRSAV